MNKEIEKNLNDLSEAVGNMINLISDNNNLCNIDIVKLFKLNNSIKDLHADTTKIDDDMLNHLVVGLYDIADELIAAANNYMANIDDNNIMSPSELFAELDKMEGVDFNEEV